MYDSWVISFYNILFTGLPIFLVAAFDQPISRRQIMDYPPLYRNGIRHQSVRALSEARHHQMNPNSLTHSRLCPSVLVVQVLAVAAVGRHPGGRCHHVLHRRLPQ
jgi:magnesium-transporting ATPase (P-type)